MVSRIVAARIVRERSNEICLFMEKKYAPYTKWFGTGFSKLSIAPTIPPILSKVLVSEKWKERKSDLSRVYEIVATVHNALGTTEPLSTRVSEYHDRPYLVIHADEFAAAIRAAIEDESIRNIRVNIGIEINLLRAPIYYPNLH